MKYQIKIKDFLKIFNPLEEFFVYKNEEVQLNTKTLEECIVDQRNIPNIFYKDLVEYLKIYQEKKWITTDLNQKFCIQNGLLEFCANIYMNEQNILIKAPNVEENNKFFKTTKVISLTNEEKWKDIQDAIDEIKINDYQKIWSFEENLNNIQNIIKKIKKSNISNEDDAKKFLYDWNKLNDTTKENEDVLKEIFSLPLRSLKILLNHFAISQISIINQHQFLHFLKEKIDGNNFELLDIFFEESGFVKGLEDEEKYHNFLIQLKPIINNPKVINFMLDKRMNKIDELGINIEKVFNFIIKPNSQVIQKYLDIKFESYIGYEALKQIIESIDIEYYEDKMILNKFIDSNNPNMLNNSYAIELLIKFFHKNNYQNKLLTDINFFIENKCYQSQKLLDYYSSYKKLNKEDIIKILKKNSSFFMILNNSPMYKNFIQDKEVLQYAKINLSFMKDHIDVFLQDENLVFNLLNENLIFEMNQYNLSNEQWKKFKEKYIKPEYIFFHKKFGSQQIIDDKRKILTKIKSADEIIKILEKIQSLKDDEKREFYVNSFYFYLHPNLKNNISIMNVLIKMNDFINYESLSPILKNNLQINMHYLENHPKMMKDIPLNLFFEKDFIQKVMKNLDEKKMNISQLPQEIINFLETNEIKNDYEKSINTIIYQLDLYKELKNENSIKKMKI